MDTQGWVFAEHPPPSPIPLLLFAPSPWHQSSCLTLGFHRGARLRPLRLMNAERGCCCCCICKNVTDQAIKHRQVRFHIPTSPSSLLLCGSDVALCCTSYPYATAVCLALGELSVTLPKLYSKRLLETTLALQQNRNSLINLIRRERQIAGPNTMKKL